MPAQTTLSSFYKSQKFCTAKPSSILGKSLLGQRLKAHPYAKLETTTKSTDILNSKDDAKIQSGSLRGVSQNLLERVRAKERNAQPTLTRDQHRSRVVASRLPEMMNIIKTYFFMEKKNVIAMETVCNIVYSTSKSCIGKDEVEEHIKLLSEQLPEWLVIFTVRKEQYVRVNKTADDSSFEGRLSVYISKVNQETDVAKDSETTDTSSASSPSKCDKPRVTQSTPAVLDVKSPNTLPHPAPTQLPQLVDKPLVRNKENVSKSRNKLTRITKSKGQQS